jgi:hypothetical protein
MLGLIINGITLEAAPFHYQFITCNVAHVGMHARARRVQRGLDASWPAIARNLRILGRAHHALADRPDGSDFTPPLTGGGAWCGIVRDPRQEFDKALVVRTFLGGEG